MEKRGGDRFWIDRFFARHLVLVYYWIMVFYYFFSPANAYDVNIKIEEHAYETYSKYLKDHPNDQKIKEIAQDELNHVQELNEALSMLNAGQIKAEKSFSNIEIITAEDISPRLIINETYPFFLGNLQKDNPIINIIINEKKIIIFSFTKFRCITKFVASKNLRNSDKTISSSIFLRQSNVPIEAELNKDNAISAVTGFVNLFSVLLKLTNKIKINKAVIRGIKGIRVVEFMKFPTKVICI